jgi:hypothetical protein
MFQKLRYSTIFHKKKGAWMNSQFVKIPIQMRKESIVSCKCISLSTKKKLSLE